MKAPLVPVALVYAAGLLVGRFVEAPLLFAFIACIVLAAGALLVKQARVWLLAGSLLVFGWLNLTLRTAVISPVDLRTLVQDRALLATVRGTLTGAPTHRVSLRDDHESWRTLAELAVDEVRIASGEWQPAHGRVLTLTSGAVSAIEDGQRMEATGVLLEPERPIADGLFDYRTHLARRGIYYQLKIESPGEWSVVGSRNYPGVAARFRAWAQGVLAHGLPEQDEALRLQWAMLLGWQTALTNEVSEPFMRSGTMHIFAISGLHIALIAGILLMLLRALVVPRFACGFIVIPLIWFYTMATGWQPSAIRSTIMMTVIIGGWMSKRPMNLLNSLAAAACIILVWDPQQLFQASFQLSFFVVLSIALLAPRFDEWKKRWLAPEEMLPMELRPWWQRRLLRLGDWAWKCFATSAAAFVGSVPLIAYYFHLFTPGSLLANLVVVPVSGLALMSGLGAILTGGWLPALAEYFNHAGWFFMRLMMWLSEGATQLPLSWRHVSSPGAPGFVLYYGALLAWLGGWFRKPVLRWSLAVVFIGIGIFIGATHFAQRSYASITVLPLSGTYALVAREPRRSDRLLINCGDDSSFPFVLKPFLQSVGENQLAHLVLAQGDTPHGGAMLAVEKLFHVERVHVVAQPSRSTKFRELLSDLELRTTVVRDQTTGTKLSGWQVLHPEANDRVARGRDNAVVLLGTFDGVRVLVLNDLGLRGQSALIERGKDLRADIVIAGMPGADEPLPDELIQRIQPKVIVIADSEFPASKRAGVELQTRLRRTGVPVFYTRASGAVTLRMRTGVWEVTAAR
jgi:competence protein ComEC